MADLGSQNNRITVNVASGGNKTNVSTTYDSSIYYSNIAREWAISNQIVSNEDYSSKYYANKSKQQADIATAKATEVNNVSTQAITDINTAKTSAVSNIKTTGATQVSNIQTVGSNALIQLQTKKTEAINEVGLTGTAGKASIFEKGSVQDNEDIYANVYDLAHSTFDLSRFTVVGNPNITNDGIASGFSSENYVKCYYTNDSTDNYSYQIKYHNNTLGTQEVIFSEEYNTSNVSLGVAIYKLSNGFLNINISDGTNSQVYNVPNFAFQSNTDYLIKFECKNNNYYVYVNGVLVDSRACTTYRNTSVAYCILGARYVTSGAQIPLNGSIDLKQFSITVDGKPVFSGNKTGIDTIKPDDYTVVGEPVISADGIASGFSNSNYITLPFSADAPFKVTCLFEYNVTADNQQVIFQPNRNIWVNAVMIEPDGKIKLYLALQGSSIAVKNFICPTQGYGNYLITFEWTGTEYKFNVKKDDINIYNSNYTSSIKLYTVGSDDINQINLGKSNNSATTYGALTAGSIDLNSFKIYVDGNFVYQPCLKIPYTLSKTGSKIVDAAYRDRVQDVYEQYGTAMYYTIDEENENFTLPMGEIYGMIEQKSDTLDLQEVQCVVETYQNGSSWYRVWSDGWCEQGGSVFNNTVSLTYNATFLKPFIDNNYTITTSFTSSSTDSSTIHAGAIAYRSANEFSMYIPSSASGLSWKAEGYLTKGE